MMILVGSGFAGSWTAVICFTAAQDIADFCTLSKRVYHVIKLKVDNHCCVNFTYVPGVNLTGFTCVNKIWDDVWTAYVKVKSWKLSIFFCCNLSLIYTRCTWYRWIKKAKKELYNVIIGSNLWCISLRFYYFLLAFMRRAGPLVTRHYLYHNSRFGPHCC